MNIKPLFEILKSISIYFDSIKDHILKIDHAKYLALTDNLYEATQIQDKIKKMTYSFEFLHLVHMCLNYLDKCYELLDFKIEFQDTDMSKTWVSDKMSRWHDITKQYKKFLKQAKDYADDLVDIIWPETSKFSDIELQKQFHAFPMAVDLYVKCMKDRIDTAYKSGDQLRATLLTDMVEADKSHSLMEKKVVNPYFKLGLYANTKITEIKNLELPDIVATTLEGLADALKAKQIGLIAVWRQQPINYLAFRPPPTDATRGLIEKDLCRVVWPLPEENEWKWEIRTWHAHLPQLVAIEILGPKFVRLMTPWADSAQFIIPRHKLAKVLNKQLGRAEAYYRICDQLLKKAINPYITQIGQREFPSVKSDVALNKVKIVDPTLAAFAETKSEASGEKRLTDPKLWKAWQSAMLIHLDGPVETQLYLLAWLEKQLIRDVLLHYKRDKPDDIDIWFSSNLGKIFGVSIEKNENIFSILKRKQSILTDVAALKA